jgi:hypothetical protein
MTGCRWRSVADELPTYTGRYLVHTVETDVFGPVNDIFVASYWKPDNEWQIFGLYSQYITHWMPIPPLEEE